MTALQVYDAVLVELNKLKAPSMLLEDFNYFINKASQQYTNLAYTRLEVNQQATDDLRVLKTHFTAPLTKCTVEEDGYTTHYSVPLPMDYLHLCNCIVKYKAGSEKNACGKTNANLKAYPARRLSVDMLPQIISNAYLCPSKKRPYYYILNDNLKSETSPYPYEYCKSPILQIYLGDTVSEAPEIYCEYIKTPSEIELTRTQMNVTDVDTSQVLEFPDYVCYEIVNIIVRLVMENASDPRLQTNMPINNTITGPSES